MDLLMSTAIRGADQSTWFPLAFLIHSFLQNHKIVGSIDIGKQDITFSKAVFFTVGRIDYEPYGLVCRDGIVYYEGSAKFNYPNDMFFFRLVSAIRALKPGYLVKL